MPQTLTAPAPSPARTRPRCAVSGCERPGSLRCEYVDRDGAGCPTRWCRGHMSRVRERVFCRRHAGVVRALPAGTPMTGTLPPVDNRALSLLRWTGETLDPLMRRVLQQHRPDGTLLVDPVRLVSQRGQHLWRRSWAVADATGQTAIDLDVAEESDALLIASVDGRVVAQSIPPWVTHRTSDPERDLFLRRAFYERVVTAVHAAVKGTV